MKRRAFTITELITAMVVLAFVVAATIPIVRKKMEKVSYSQYWMGYNTAVEIAKNLSGGGCDFEFGSGSDKCWKLTPVSNLMNHDECFMYKSRYGITYCCEGRTECQLHKYDYWMSAVQTCGHKDNLPTLSDLADLANKIYGRNDIADTTYIYSGLSVVRSEIFNKFNGGSPFTVWSNYEESGTLAGDRSYRLDNTIWGTGSRYSASSPITLCLYHNAGANFCNSIKDKFNTAEYNCALDNATDSSDFTNPHITLSNGVRLFIGSGFEELFPDAESENDKTGYKIYVDINGSKGKGILWEDVFPFYVLKSGKVLAGYPSDAEIGGNNNEYLSVNVLYDDFSSGKRVVKILQSNMNYRQAMCATGMIKSATYCGGITVLSVCNNVESDCRLKVKSPIKIF